MSADGGDARVAGSLRTGAAKESKLPRGGLLRRPVLKTGCACGNGTYRIEWVFARNAAGAPVLRRNGNDTAERAVTQFPLT
jgi:hypothetical protein